MSRRTWFGTHRRFLRRAAALCLALAVLFFALCGWLSYRAAEIFDETAAGRDLFPGTVSAERVRADILGRVEIEGLRWTADDGTLLAEVPRARCRISLWDAVTGRIGSLSVKDAELEHAHVRLFFDENMRPLHIRREWPEESAASGEKRAGKERPFDCRLRIRDSLIEAEAPGRRFSMEHADLRADIDTKREIRLGVLAGPFTGTVSADRLAINGALDMRKEEPEFDMALSVAGLRPSSLDEGIGIDDPASFTARISGGLSRPVIKGVVEMPVLDLPALHFTNVKGDFSYAGGGLHVYGVKGEIYGGTVDGEGQFDLDSRAYAAELRGHGLKGGIAADDNRLRCSVELILRMTRGADGAEEIDGSFESGPGRYHFLPFNGISGAFEKIGRTITFRDVTVSLALGDVKTEAFRIRDGKLELGPVYLEDALSGKTERVR